LTTLVRDCVAEHETLKRASEPDMCLICLRAVPEWCRPDERDGLNGRLQ
jgi:hypothetical protein